MFALALQEIRATLHWAVQHATAVLCDQTELNADASGLQLPWRLLHVLEDRTQLLTDQIVAL